MGIACLPQKDITLRAEPIFRLKIPQTKKGCQIDE